MNFKVITGEKEKIWRVAGIPSCGPGDLQSGTRVYIQAVWPEMSSTGKIVNHQLYLLRDTCRRNVVRGLSHVETRK